MGALRQAAVAIRTEALAKQTLAVANDNLSYYISGGKVYQRNYVTGATNQLGRMFSKAKAVLMFKRLLVVLREDEEVDAWNPSQQKWQEIGDDAEQILATDDSLVVLAHSSLSKSWGRGLYVNDGPPPENFKGVSLYLDFPLHYAGVKDVASISPIVSGDKHDILVSFADGTSRPFSQLAKK